METGTKKLLPLYLYNGICRIVLQSGRIFL